MKFYKTKHIIALFLAFAIYLSAANVYAFPIFEEKPLLEARVPIIMYHLVTTDSRYQGKFGISPQELENDLKYLSENGYETIDVEDLIRFSDCKDNLPDNPVMLTFDDGAGSDYYYLYPLLEKYDYKAVVSVIGKVAEDYSKDGKSGKKPHANWEQLKEMHKSKRVELQNHSYNMHGAGGSGKKKGEDEQTYKNRLKADLEKAQEVIQENTGGKPTAFTYPLGVISKGSDEVLKEMGFKASFSCAEGINIIKQEDKDGLFRLKRNIRPQNRPIREILKTFESTSDK